MTKFYDPLVLEQDLSALKNLWHTMNGLYVWEFITTLDYELDVIRGRRPHGWSIWIYSLSRVATLLAVALNFVGLNSVTQINCQVWLAFELVFGYLGLAAASLLIVLRIFAIWDKNKVVVAVATGLWLTNLAFIIQGIARLRSAWSPAQRLCIVLNTEVNKLNIIVILIADIILLLTVLVGLIRLRYHGGGMLGLGRLLWKQGVIWLLLSVAADVPPTVFIILDLNEPLSLMFQLPSLVTMSIAATRMYRSLSDFVSIAPNNLPKCAMVKISKTKWDDSAPILHNRIEVVLDTTEEQIPISQETHCESYISQDRQICEKM